MLSLKECKMEKLLEESNRKNVTHWAAELQTGDRCIATIRHQTDESLNIIGATIIVIENNREMKHIKAWYDSPCVDMTEYILPYNELSQNGTV